MRKLEQKPSLRDLTSETNVNRQWAQFKIQRNVLGNNYKYYKYGYLPETYSRVRKVRIFHLATVSFDIALILEILHN